MFLRALKMQREIVNSLRTFLDGDIRLVPHQKERRNRKSHIFDNLYKFGHDKNPPLYYAKRGYHIKREFAITVCTPSAFRAAVILDVPAASIIAGSRLDVKKFLKCQ